MTRIFELLLSSFAMFFGQKYHLLAPNRRFLQQPASAEQFPHFKIAGHMTACTAVTVSAASRHSCSR
jgi:hypothetical protein